MVEANRTRHDAHRAIAAKPVVKTEKAIETAPKAKAEETKAEAVVAAPAAETKAAETKATENKMEGSRLDEQKRYANVMLRRLKSDVQLTAIMLNPLFAIHAQAIATAATARAVSRYENEVPQKDFSVLMAEEQAAANKAILNLPTLYYNKGAEALNATGDALLSAYDATGEVLVEAYDASAEVLTTAAEATGNFFTKAAGAFVGVFAAMGMGIAHGIGGMFNWIGKGFSRAGESLTHVGE